MKDINFDGLFETHSIEYFKQKLSPNRYELAISAYNKMQASEKNKYHPLFQLLLQEQYETQEALAFLNAHSNSNLSQLNQIDTILPTRSFPDRSSQIPLIVEVMGNPSIGKTTLIESSLINFNFYYRKEVARKARRKLEQQNNELSAAGIPIIDTELFLENWKLQMNWETYKIVNRIYSGIRPNLPILADRWLVDANIFGRTLFLRGELGLGVPRHFNSPASPLDAIDQITLGNLDDDNNLFTYPNVQFAIINCLAAPPISTERDKDKGKLNRKVMYLESLNSHHEQYLRFHMEMLMHKRPFLYASLDLTSNNLKENQQKFNTTLETIFDFYHKFNYQKH